MVYHPLPWDTQHVRETKTSENPRSRYYKKNLLRSHFSDSNDIKCQLDLLTLLQSNLILDLSKSQRNNTVLFIRREE